MADELVIRGVAPTDFDQWLPLWEGYNLILRAHRYTAAIPDEVTNITWGRFFDFL